MVIIIKDDKVYTRVSTIKSPKQKKHSTISAFKTMTLVYARKQIRTKEKVYQKKRLTCKQDQMEYTRYLWVILLHDFSST